MTIVVSDGVSVIDIYERPRPWRWVCRRRWAARVRFGPDVGDGDVMPLSFGRTRTEALDNAAAEAMEFLHGPDWRRIAAENKAAGL